MNLFLAHGPPPSIIALAIVIYLIYLIAPLVSIALGLRHIARRGLGVIFAVLPIAMFVYLSIAISLKEITEIMTLAVLILTPAMLGFVGLIINLTKKNTTQPPEPTPTTAVTTSAE